MHNNGEKCVVQKTRHAGKNQIRTQASGVLRTQTNWQTRQTDYKTRVVKMKAEKNFIKKVAAQNKKTQKNKTAKERGKQK